MNTVTSSSTRRGRGGGVTGRFGPQIQIEQRVGRRRVGAKIPKVLSRSPVLEELPSSERLQAHERYWGSHFIHVPTQEAIKTLRYRMVIQHTHLRYNRIVIRWMFSTVTISLNENFTDYSRHYFPPPRPYPVRSSPACLKGTPAPTEFLSIGARSPSGNSLPTRLRRLPSQYPSTQLSSCREASQIT